MDELLLCEVLGRGTAVVLCCTPSLPPAATVQAALSYLLLRRTSHTTWEHHFKLVQLLFKALPAGALARAPKPIQQLLKVGYCMAGGNKWSSWRDVWCQVL